MPVKITRRFGDGTYEHLDRRTGRLMFGYEIQVGVEHRRGHAHVKKRRKSGFTTKELAEQARAAVRLRPMLEAHGLVQQERVTFAQLLAAWVADARDRELNPDYIARVEFVASHFAAQFKAGFALDEINAESIRLFKARRVDEKTHVHTLYNDLGLLKSLFESARAHFPFLRWAAPPINRPQKEYDSRNVVLTPAEIDRLLAAIDAADESGRRRRDNLLLRDYILVSLHTARRESEILTLEKSQVNFEARDDAPFGEIKFRLKKKGKKQSKAAAVRVIPMTAAVASIIKRRVRDSRDGLLFLELNLKQTVMRLRRAFNQMCDVAEIARGYESGGAVLHTLRHSAATYLSSLGLPLEDIQAILGHDSVAMSLKYIHTTPQGIAAAVRALSRLGVRLESQEAPQPPVISARRKAAAKGKL